MNFGKRRAAFCECGQPKPDEKEACASCLWIDGRNGSHRSTIGALRDSGPSTADYVSSYTGKSKRQEQRNLKDLMADGRVIAFIAEETTRGCSVVMYRLASIDRRDRAIRDNLCFWDECSKRFGGGASAGLKKFGESVRAAMEDKQVIEDASIGEKKC